MEKCLKDHSQNNFLLALRVQTLADALRDAERFEESETQYVRC